MATDLANLQSMPCAARERCWRSDWVLGLDIKAFFDSIDWELMLRAVRKHTDCPWVLLYMTITSKPLAKNPANLCSVAVVITTTRQYARLVSSWVATIGLGLHFFGTHSLRRTKATLIYRRTGNLRAVQLLLGHTKIERTVRYLGIEVDDALAIAEQVDV
jgi:integrase